MPIIRSPGNAWCVPSVERAGLLVDARDYYTAFYDRALRARRFILLAGWQFDRDVDLLRGNDVALAEAANGQVQLLKFLNQRCEENPQLQVLILAWDFHIVFALEREWMQKIYFHWGTNERMKFLFDERHAEGGCHHQKFAVIDGQYAFLGGIDLCQSRWDDRRHLAENPQRAHAGKPQKPYHDVQAYFTGPEINGALMNLFADRWTRAGGERCELPEPGPASEPQWMPRGALPLPAPQVALSRTDPRPGESSSALEVCELLSDAVAAAERFIYVENQYFSSRQMFDAFEARLRAPNRPKLQIVMVLNQDAEALKEEVAVGFKQSENIERLRRTAAETGHALGVFYALAEGTVRDEEGKPQPVSTYIHSKLMIVDDRFFTMGSANLTNRSMGVDTELNASWEISSAEDPRLERAIRRVRVSLLAEHTGRAEHLRALATAGDLVAHLERHGGRLRLVPPMTDDERALFEVVDPQALPFDPERPDGRDAEGHDRSLFRGGISALWHRLKD